MADHDDHWLAAELATSAGELLLALRADLTDEGVSPAEMKDAGDKASHDHIMATLAERRPHDAVLSEEGKDDAARLGADRVWIVDPLDGTREFGEVPRTDWAVHIALVEDGVPTAGAVSLPGRRLTLSTAEPAVLPAAHGGPPRVICSRTRPGPAAETVVAALGGELVTMGSAGAKAMAVLLGEADIYPHTGGQYEWDSCAPVAVARAAGLHASRLDGSPLLYNQADVYLPDLLVCRPELLDATLAALAATAE